MTSKNRHRAHFLAGQYAQDAYFGPEELKQAMGALGRSGAQLAEELMVDDGTFSRWKRGAVPIPGPAIAYLRLRVKLLAAFQGLY
jgi:DNA-binding transcriptional regulator YiaG